MRIYWSFGFLRRVQIGQGGTAAESWSRKLRVYIINHTQEAEREGRGWGQVYKPLASTANDVLPPLRPHLLEVH